MAFFKNLLKKIAPTLIIALIAIAIVNVDSAYAEMSPGVAQSIEDLKTSLTYMYKASYKQFTMPSTWVYMGATTPALVYAFNKDKEISNKYILNPGKKRTALEVLAVGSTFPIIPFAGHAIGSMYGNEKLTQFSMELFSATYLALVESAVFSFIPVHKRPSDKDLNFWETSFRGDSSFPSGHIIPMAALTFKTMQFYGPYWAIAPAVATYFIGKERVESGKHYLSDVIGGVLFAAMASEGVRLVANYANNDSFYKWLYERNVTLDLKVSHTVKYAGLIFNY